MCASRLDVVDDLVRFGGVVFSARDGGVRFTFVAGDEAMR